MIIYFTGTGNSRYCAQMLAQRLEDEVMDAFSLIREGKAVELSSEKPWVFVAPTYSWQLPHVFTAFLRRCFFRGSVDAYFVMTCGGDIGGAPAHNHALCHELGLTYRGTLEVVMPENYIALFSVPTEEQARTIIAKAHPTLEQGADYIRKGQDFPASKGGVLDKLKSGAINEGFYRFFVKAKLFSVSDNCIGCGKCEQSCPLGNIKLSQGKPAWHGRCTHCMACICGCPVQAIEYGKRSHGKPRYRCPDYQPDRK